MTVYKLSQVLHAKLDKRCLYHSSLSISQILPGVPAFNLDDKFLVKRERRFFQFLLMSSSISVILALLSLHLLTVSQKWSKSTAS